MRYPISPEYLSRIPGSLIDIYDDLEAKVIAYICEQFKTGSANATSLEFIRFLQQRGIDLDEIERIIKQATNLADAELDRIYSDAIQRNQRYFSDTLTKSGLLYSQVKTAALQVEIDAIAKQTKGSFQNITQSLGFAVRNNDGTVSFMDIAKTYQKVLDRAATSVWSGAFDYNSAILNAVKELSDSGLQWVDYSTGWHNRIDVAARRAVMTGIGQISSKYSEALRDELGTEFVEVSAHRGARDKGTGYENHKSWQGKVYHVGGPATVDGVRYPDFQSVTGYGEGSGLCGWNCRHKWYPFVPGVSERTYTDKELDEIDPPPFTYQGREYTMYEATQKQRQIETALRNVKRRMVGLEAAGQTEAYTAAAARWQRLDQEYVAFSKAADLPLQRNRANIPSFGPKQAKKALQSIG